MLKWTLPLILLAAPAFATPAITTATVSGALTHEVATITVTGTDFDTKSTASMDVYEKVESGTFSSWWADTAETYIISTTSVQKSTYSTRCQYLNFGNDLDAALEGEGTEHEKWFLSGYFRFSSNINWGTSGFGGGDDGLSNVKGPWRLWETGSEPDNWFAQYAGDENRLKADTEGISPGQSDTILDNFRTTLPTDAWVQFELLWDDSSVGSSDGTLKIWMNGHLVVDDTTIETRDGGSVFKRIHTFGFEDVWGFGGDAGGSQLPNEYYADDFYADHVWNGVFITTVSTHAGGGQREYGTPVTWGDTSLTFRLHKGFIVNQPMYVYVRNSVGEVNTNGALLGGSGSGGGEPGGSDPAAFAVDADKRSSGYRLLGINRQ